MKIDHVAIWVADLEKMKAFYVRYFNMICSQKYVNEKNKFSSYFLGFSDGARLEIMHRADILTPVDKKETVSGLTHLAISVGSIDKVDNLTEKLRTDGYVISGEPRTTGDGYYESVILDPEGNHIEITT